MMEFQARPLSTAEDEPQGLMKLPKELRLKIFEFALPASRRYSHHMRGFGEPNTATNEVALLYVNKEIYLEALDVLHKSCSLHILIHRIPNSLVRTDLEGAIAVRKRGKTFLKYNIKQYLHYEIELDWYNPRANVTAAKFLHSIAKQLTHQRSIKSLKLTIEERDISFRINSFLENLNLSAVVLRPFAAYVRGVPKLLVHRRLSERPQWGSDWERCEKWNRNWEHGPGWEFDRASNTDFKQALVKMNSNTNREPEVSAKDIFDGWKASEVYYYY